MTHHIDTMAAKQTPWHGLGRIVADGITADEMIGAAGLDWTVQKRPLFYIDPATGTQRVAPQQFGLVRADTGGFLSTCGKDYKPIQNATVLGFFSQFAEAAGFKIDTAGSLMGGKYVWALAKTPDGFTVGGDEMASYLLMMEPHVNGKAALLQYTAVQVVCWNTLNMALGSGLKGGPNAYKWRHVMAWDEAAQRQAAHAVGLAKDRSAEYKVIVETLAEKRVSRDWSTDFFKRLLKLDEYQSDTKAVEAYKARTAAKAAKAAADKAAAAAKAAQRAAIDAAAANPDAGGLPVIPTVALDADVLTAAIAATPATLPPTPTHVSLDAVLSATPDSDHGRQRTSPTLIAMEEALGLSPGADLPARKGTAWGAVNAVTYVQDHVAGRDQDTRLRDLWLGQRGDLKREAVTLALELAA